MSAGDRDELVVIEQAGVDLRVRRGATISNSPLGRMGPEFIYVAARDTAELALEPLYPATGDGRFRFTRIPLETQNRERLGQLLSEGGADF